MAQTKASPVPDHSPSGPRQRVGWARSGHRVAPPERVADYAERRNLVRRCMPAGRPLTLLKAPGGFGKTTLLAECCRALRHDAVPVAWLTAEHESADALTAHLQDAFEAAGLDRHAEHRAAAGETARDRLASLVAAVHADGRPWVLALDQLERIRNRDAVELLNELVRSHPPGLSLAIACRVLPHALDISQPVFGGDARLLTAEDLRFSRKDIGRYFGGHLSRRELDGVVQDTAGWPIALRAHRSAGTPALPADHQVALDIVDNWIESRLWYDLPDNDRDFLLDVGLVDPIDGELLDKALEGIHLLQRLDSISSIKGLIEPVRGRPGVWRMHALLRRHCTLRRRSETPERFAAITRRVAGVLAGRGHTLNAMRHASDANDPVLSGQILFDAGGVRRWVRNGFDPLVEADRLLTDASLDAHPSLGLVRAVALATRGDIPGARRAYQLATDELDRQGASDDPELYAHRWMARGAIVNHTCEPTESTTSQAVVAEIGRIAGLPGLDPNTRTALECALCLTHGVKAEFDDATAWAGRILRPTSAPPDFLSALVVLQLGEIAMARGHADAATRHYRHVMDTTTDGGGDRVREHAEILLRELNLEKNTVPNAAEALPATVSPGTAGFSVQAAACGIVADMTRERRGAAVAIAVVARLLDQASGAELPGLVVLLAASKADLLAATGNLAEAERTWRAAGLPTDDDDCLDLERRSWRAVEALACARLRQLVAAGDHDAARPLAARLIDIADSRGLVRTAMRARVIAMTGEERAGNRCGALDHLAAFLAHFEATGYARPLLREPDATTLLDAYLEDAPDDAGRAAARTLRDAVLTAATEVPSLGPRQREVLNRLATSTDREIAADLGLTHDGVRYHIRKLFARLGVRRRRQAVERARQLGLLSPDG